MLALLTYAVSHGDQSTAAAIRHFVFDTYQQLLPRVRISAPVTIVAVDEDSLAALGQWPWPRSRIAALLNAIGEHKPAAIGIDILFSEPDRLSPDMADWRNEAPGEVQQWLSKRPSNDAVLAATLKKLPVVLGIAGMESSSPQGRLTFSKQTGPGAASKLRPYPGLLRSLDQIDAAAAGHGILSADPDRDGVVRRAPLVARAGAALIPSLEVEMLRIAVGANWFTLSGDDEGAKTVAVGDLVLPVHAEGTLWIHYGPHDPARFVSSASVLDGTVDPAMLKSKLVLLGVTGLGLIDYPATPVVSRMPGVEIRAQILESIFDNNLLSRPYWAGWAEAGLTFLFCGFLTLTVPVVRPRLTPFLWLAGGGLVAASGFAAFGFGALLFDVAIPWLSGSLIFLVLLAATLAEADYQRLLYKRDLELQREREAMFAGELEAARRIQMGILPNARLIMDPQQRVDIAALLVPAREVGGDFYDLFLMDSGDRLFFLVADVAGKGIPASLFMALGKSLYKSAVLRRRKDISLVMSEANAEISRDNPEQMFITCLAAILDLTNGKLSVCNAGHDAPLLKAPGKPSAFWHGAGGPPMCVIDDFTYPGEVCDLAPGTAIIMFTDGVTEAMNPDGAIYGHTRIIELLDRLGDDLKAEEIADAIYSDVKAHTFGAPTSDDIAIVVTIWHGPRRVALFDETPMMVNT